MNTAFVSVTFWYWSEWKVPPRKSNFITRCNIHHTLLSEMLRTCECRQTERVGLCSKAVVTLAMLSGMRTIRVCCRCCCSELLDPLRNWLPGRNFSFRPISKCYRNKCCVRITTFEKTFQLQTHDVHLTNTSYWLAMLWIALHTGTNISSLGSCVRQWHTI